jgi:meiotically up-regulated gene 157 (Mug157) protein
MKTTRRKAIKGISAAASSLLLSPMRGEANEISRRPPKEKRRFVSESVDAAIARIKPHIGDARLAWMFENCFPNTLDTTVKFRVSDGKPDTFVITGDIDAMWLRDSSAQVWPYLAFSKDDKPLRRMIAGVIRRQTMCILIDPYANAFMPDPQAKPLSWAVNDNTEKKPGVGERKWEIDSLCYPIRLAHGYWKKTGDSSSFDASFRKAMARIVATFREQQRKNSPGPYKFQRRSETPTETQFTGGYGNPTRKIGLIHSMFRPSDDACLFPLFIPANLFAVTSLRHLAELASSVLNDRDLAADSEALAQEVSEALEQFGRIHKDVWAYEVDGYGNQLFMDDANAPGLLSLPYLECCDANDPIYQRTRERVWSTANPYFFAGSAAEGIGGPHEGLDMIWPMSIMMKALTSSDDDEIRRCLTWLKNTDAGTGFMHESFHKDDPRHFTRPWFAWANTLFGELILKLHDERPNLLNRV